MDTGTIRVIVAGALGKMGIETVQAINQDGAMQLVGLADARGREMDFAEHTGIREIHLPVAAELEGLLNTVSADVLVDFTAPQAVAQNVRLALEHGLHAVVGTTGLTAADMEQLENLAEERGVGLAIIPNFALGAVLMMRLAQEASHYFPQAEIIELHHDQKVDAPSGTAMKTAEMIRQGSGPSQAGEPKDFEKVAGARGGEYQQLRIHSVRLPGLVAHQEVIFGGQGETLRIRHDSYNRTSFMPGVILTVKRILEHRGLIYGLDKLL